MGILFTYKIRITSTNLAPPVRLLIADEIIPETHRTKYKTVATFSLLGDFVVLHVSGAMCHWKIKRGSAIKRKGLPD